MGSCSRRHTSVVIADIGTHPQTSILALHEVIESRDWNLSKPILILRNELSQERKHRLGIADAHCHSRHHVVASLLAASSFLWRTEPEVENHIERPNGHLHHIGIDKLGHIRRHPSAFLLHVGKRSILSRPP